MSLLAWLRAWLAARKEDRRAIARARLEMSRAGDEPTRSQKETVEDAAGGFPAAS